MMTMQSERTERTDHGREASLRVRVKADCVDGPVLLVRSQQDGRWTLWSGSQTSCVVPMSSDDLATAHRVLDAGARAHLYAEPIVGDAQRLTVTFMADVVHLAEPLTVRLPADLQSRLGGTLDDWARRELVFGDGLLAFAGTDRPVSLARPFTLLGRTRSLRIQPDDAGGWVATKMTSKRRRKHAVRLVGAVQLLSHDGPAPDEQDDREPVDTSAFLTLWDRYLALDKARIAELEQRLGGVRVVERRYVAGHIVFTTEAPVPPEWRNEQLRVSLALHGSDGKPVSLGELDPRADVASNEVAVGLPHDDAGVPSQGTLRVDPFGDRVRQGRQSTALKKVRDGVAQMPDLLSVLDGRGRPTRTTPIVQATTARLLRTLEYPLTPAQERAVSCALNTPDIAVIQGPPGTGKTTVIRAIAERLHELGRGPVLISSYQHEAVLRAIEGITVGDLPVIRVGGRRSEDATERDRPLLAWRDGVVETLDATLSTLSEGPLVEQHRRLSERVEAWRRDPGGRPGTRNLLVDIERIAANVLRPELLTELTAALLVLNAPEVEAVVLGDLERSTLTDLLASQRLTDVAWDDDGRARLRALFRFTRRSTAVPQNVVDQLAQWDGRPRNAARPETLEAVIDALRPLTQPPRPVESWRVSDELRGLINRCIADVSVAADQAGRVMADALERLRAHLTEDGELIRNVLAHHAHALGATVQQAVGKDMTSLHPVFDTVIIDEAARANPLDLLIPLVLARRIILVGDQRQLPHMLEPTLETALDAESTSEVYRETLFARLWDLYDTSPPGGIQRTTRLDEQFRMEPVVGDFIGRTFYAGGVRTHVSRTPSAPLLGLPVSAPMAWFDVPNGRERQSRGSRARLSEVQRIDALLERFLAEPSNQDLSVGIISFYRAQVAELTQQIDSRGWMHRVHVGTVDAFQGREFDVVLISCVRAGPSVGFLQLPNRLNVALSRARRFVGVVGRAATVCQIPSLREFHRVCSADGALC